MNQFPPSIPKGTRDFGPVEMHRRDFIFSTIRQVFQLYGFQPIETPAMENLQTLLGKYGEEGDKLLFRILNSGNYLQNVPIECLHSGEPQKILPFIAEKGLRYDLTVPFARYVVQHHDEITFPFKRYQIQPVWRADRPQKGRYREFYQCDADVIGSKSLLNEGEFINIIDEVFSRLNIKVSIRLNNRKILAGIAEYIGHGKQLIDITTSIDKLDKIGLDEVDNELSKRGISTKAIEKLHPLLFLIGENEEKLNELQSYFTDNHLGIEGINEMKSVLEYASAFEVEAKVIFDQSLARGLNYYTGTIIEVTSLDVNIGSICGGGRYDDLTGIFGLPNVSGVGISFGADRIYDVMEQTGAFPHQASISTQILFVNFGSHEAGFCIRLISNLRANNISAELFPETSKLKKQLAYANAKSIPYVAIVGEDELNTSTITLKDMTSGTQEKLTVERFFEKMLKMLSKD